MHELTVKKLLNIEQSFKLKIHLNKNWREFGHALDIIGKSLHD
jgi:hypothetical protein